MGLKSVKSDAFLLKEASGWKHLESQYFAAFLGYRFRPGTGPAACLPFPVLVFLPGRAPPSPWDMACEDAGSSRWKRETQVREIVSCSPVFPNLHLSIFDSEPKFLNSLVPVSLVALAVAVWLVA